MQYVMMVALFICALGVSSLGQTEVTRNNASIQLDDAGSREIALNLPHVWNLNEVTEKEKMDIREMRQLIVSLEGEHGSWIRTSTDIDLLRFLRQAHGSLLNRDAVKRAVNAMVKHSEWRDGPNGATFIYREMKDEYENHILNDEFYWIGPSIDDACPTLVVRSQLHDGVNYNDDNKYFVRFIMYKMEQGTELYGIGPEKEFCLIVDRTDATARDGTVKKDEFDLSVVPQIVDLLKTVYSVLWPNYPKVLKRAQVLPSTWFFASCWTVARRFLDPSISNKFEIIQEKHIAQRLLEQFSPTQLPKRFGGQAEDFIPDKRIDRKSVV